MGVGMSKQMLNLCKDCVKWKWWGGRDERESENVEKNSILQKNVLKCINFLVLDSKRWYDIN